MHARPLRHWLVGRRRIELGERTRVMAIMNLTPDSFYAASRVSAGGVLAAAARALDAGADALDLGAESTRPGAAPLTPAQEQARLLPALTEVRLRFPEALLSVDTRHAATAERALDAGADVINDVTGLEDAAMRKLITQRGCGAVLMHHRGEFATMHHLPPLADPAAVVRSGLEAIAARARAGGVEAEQIVLDPGFGFGKNLAENFPLLARLGELHALGYPLLAGLSRKSFLARPLADAAGGAGPRARPSEAAQTKSGRASPEQRLAASLAAVTAAALAGAHWVRVHDVPETVEAVRIADRLRALAAPELAPGRGL